MLFLNRKYAEPKTPNQRSENKADFFASRHHRTYRVDLHEPIDVYPIGFGSDYALYYYTKIQSLPTRSQRMETVACFHRFNFGDFIYLDFANIFHRRFAD